MSTTVAEGNVAHTRPTVASPVAPSARIAAVLFDLDGTLYAQRPLRLRMALELLIDALRSPIGAPRRSRALQAYRHAQEILRASGQPITAEAQLRAASERSGMPLDELRALVEEWMSERPLKHLPGCLDPGALPLLAWLADRGVALGVLSDYPAAAKLRALGLDRHFELVLSATDPGVGAFKPSPRGFLHACARWNLAPAHVLFVGDRVDVDAVGAAAAGMPSVIVTRDPSRRERPAGSLILPSLERLHRVLADGR